MISALMRCTASSRTSVTMPCLSGRAVVGRHRHLADQPLRDQLAEQPVRGRGAEHHLDGRAAREQGLRERDQRRAAVPAADEHRRRRPGRDGERLTERPDDVQPLPRAAVHQPPRARPVLGDDELDRAGEVAGRRRAVQREGAAQQHRRVLAADRDRDELPGLRVRRDARRDHGELDVRADLLHREDLRVALLHRDAHCPNPRIVSLRLPRSLRSGESLAPHRKLASLARGAGSSRERSSRG